MKAKNYNAAIIGVGRIGFSLGFDKKREQPASHSFALEANKKINLIAACDTNQENLTQWAKYYKNRNTFSSVEELVNFGKTLENKHFDIIVVSVNEESHFDCVVKAIKSHPKLIILEKPVALNSEQAKEIENIANQENVKVLVNHERRFALDYNLAKKWISKIGDLQSIDAKLFSGLRVYRKEDEKTGFYSLLHDGTHLVDIVLFLLEATGNYSLTNPVLDSVFRDKEKVVRNLRVTFNNENCPDVSFFISGRCKYFGFEIDILGTLGRISIGNGFAKIYLRQESKLYSNFYSLVHQKNIRFAKKTHYFSNMIQNAVEYLDGTSELKSTLTDGINTLLILEQIKKLIA